MKILLANANTTQAVTDAVVAEARHHAAEGTEIIGGTGRFGVAIISTDAENAVAGHAMLDLLAAFPDVDAAVLATSFDTGLAGAQALMPYPVIGMTSAALHTACAMTRRFGLITFGQGSRSMYLDLVAWSGLNERMAGCSTVQLETAAAYLDHARLEQAVLDETSKLAGLGAGAVIVAGAATAGMSRRLQSVAAVPLLDGIACAVRMAETVAGLKPTPALPLVQSRRPVGLSEPLTDLLHGQPPTL